MSFHVHDEGEEIVFNKLREANILRQEVWDSEGVLTLSFKGNELAGEVGEACNLIKKIERERLGLVGSRATLEHIGEELADVVVCVDLVAAHLGIDLWEAIVKKFNKTSDKNGLDVKLLENYDGIK